MTAANNGLTSGLSDRVSQTDNMVCTTPHSLMHSKKGSVEVTVLGRSACGVTSEWLQ